LNWQPSKVFYGWWIVGATFLIAIYTGGTVFFGFTVFFEPIANELGWSYAQISFAASIRGLEIGLLAPLSGILVDRWGSRKLVLSGIVITSLGLMLLSRAISLGMFYGAFALVALGVSACSSSVLVVAVANWFRRKMGIATGITVSGFGFGGLMIPIVVRLIDFYEWRMTMVILGLGLLVIGLPLSIVLRDKPEQYGEQPDGEVVTTVMNNKDSPPLETFEIDVSASRALRSRSFWHIELALLFQFVAMQTVITHVVPYLSSLGITRPISSLVATVLPVLSVGGRLGFGWLGDKFDKRRVTICSLILTSLGLICFEYISLGRVWLATPFLLLFGIGFGSNVTMRGILLREYFGRRSFGTLLGFTMGILTLTSIAGPPLAGWVFDNWGSYHGVWLMFASLTIAGIIIVATMPPVRTT